MEWNVMEWRGLTAVEMRVIIVGGCWVALVMKWVKGYCFYLEGKRPLCYITRCNGTELMLLLVTRTKGITSGCWSWYLLMELAANKDCIKIEVVQ